MMQCIEAGFIPMAMLFRHKSGYVEVEWRKFQRDWGRPAIIRTKLKEQGVII